MNYLRKLHLRHERRPLALLMDNLPLHKANLVQALYPTLDMMPLWNVPWSPEFNPVEAVFSKVKAVFNRKRLGCLVNKIGHNIDRDIKTSFDKITAKHCGACVRKSYHLLHRAS